MGSDAHRSWSWLPAAPEGAVTRAMLTEGETLLDLRWRGADPESMPLPETHAAKLAGWLRLLARRRGQLAHDLSSPATGVLAALETVLEYEPVPDSSRSLLVEAHRGMLQLTRMLDADDGLLTAEVNAVDGPLEKLVRDAVARISSTLDPDGARLTVHVTAPSDVVRVDRSRLSGVLWTLLRNAWSLRRGARAEAEVVAGLIDGGIRVAVTDRGRGLEAEALERAGELGFTTRPSGIGLGLFTLRFSLRDRGAVRLTRLDPGCRAEVFLRSNTP